MLCQPEFHFEEQKIKDTGAISFKYGECGMTVVFWKLGNVRLQMIQVHWHDDYSLSIDVNLLSW